MGEHRARGKTLAGELSMQEQYEKVNSFILYTEQWPAISLLNDIQRSTLMQAIFALHGACPMPELDDITKAIFLLMKPRFEENRDRYVTKCEANRENGKKGGRPRKNENQTVKHENPKTERFLDKNPKTLTDSYTDSDSDPDFNTPPPLTEGPGGGGSAFAHGEEKPTPRELGTNPRAQGTNPRLTGDNPRTREPAGSRAGGNSAADLKAFADEYTQCPELRQALEDFRVMRERLRKPLTARAFQLTCTELDKLAGNDDVLKTKILDQSIQRGWQGIFPLREDSKPKVDQWAGAI